MSEIFDGTVEVQDGSANTTVLLDGTAGGITAGGNGLAGSLDVQSATSGASILLSGDTGSVRAGGSGQDGSVSVLDAANGTRVLLTGTSVGGSGIYVGDGVGNTIVDLLQVGRVDVRRVSAGAAHEVLRFDAGPASLIVGGETQSGSVAVHNDADEETILIDGAEAAIYVGATGNEGDLRVRDSDGRNVFRVDGDTAAVYIGADGKEGDIYLRDSTGRNVFIVNGDAAAVFVGGDGNEGDLFVRDGDGRDALRVDGNNAALYVGVEGNEGDIIVRDAEGRDVFHVDGNNAILDIGADGNEGDIRVFDADGDLRIHLDGGSGDILLLGADCAEDFAVRDAATVEPGTVLIIDDAGGLRESRSAYDRRVAGVVSGGGSYRPGIILDKQRDLPDRMPVALVGKVFCKVDADCGAIDVGDLLTTSDTPGHAMKVVDPARAFGAVIGKALAPLRGGRGLLPILVALQ